MTRRLEQAKAAFPCSCSVCPFRPQVQANTEAPPLINGYKCSFTWLLEELGEASTYTHVPFNVPDTVLYRKAQIQWVLLQGKDGALHFTRGAMKHSDLRRKLLKISKRRKRSVYEPFLISEVDTPVNYESTRYGKEAALVRYMRSNNFQFTREDENGPLRVMTEAELTSLMDERPGNAVWRSINYIQAALKCKGGLAETTLVQFTSADFEEEEPDQSTVQGKCLVACQRLAFFLKKHRGKTLQSIHAEFMPDDHGQLWLLETSEITVKECPEQTVHKRSVSNQPVARLRPLMPSMSPPPLQKAHVRSHSEFEQRVNTDLTASFRAFRILRPLGKSALEKHIEQLVIQSRRQYGVCELTPMLAAPPPRPKLDLWEYRPRIRVRSMSKRKEYQLPRRSASRLFIY